MMASSGGSNTIEVSLPRRLSAEAIEPMPMTPAEFGRFIESEIARWTRLARERGISLEE